MPDLLSPPTLTLVFINMLLAWSFWFPLSAGLISLANAGATAVGAYTAGMLLLSPSPPAFPLILLAAAVAAGLFAVPVGIVSLRLGGYSFALATLGISEAVRITINNIRALGAAGGLTNIQTTWAVFPAAGTLCAVIFLLSRAAQRSRLGRMIDTVAVDELQARALGIPVKAVKIFVIVAQGVVSGLAGGVMAGYLGYLEPNQFGIQLITEIFAYVVIVGIGTYVGPFFGAAVLTLALQFFVFIGNVRYVAFGVLLIMAILVRRDGALTRLVTFQRRRIEALLAAAETHEAG